MKSTPITVFSGVAYLDEEYIDISSDGSALALTSYDLQMQVLDVDDDNTVLIEPTVSKDSETTGRAWPTLSAAQTTALIGKNAMWVLLLRPSDLSNEPRLIGYGRVRVKAGATWQ